MSTESQEFIAYLRSVIEWYEAHPDVPAPYVGTPFNVFFNSRDEFSAVARRIGHAEKVGQGNWFSLRVPLGPEVYGGIEFNVRRTEVCERRVVGQKVVPRQVVEEHTEEIVEWECRSIFADEVPADGRAEVGADATCDGARR